MRYKELPVPAKFDHHGFIDRSVMARLVSLSEKGKLMLPSCEKSLIGQIVRSQLDLSFQNLVLSTFAKKQW